MGDEKKFRGIDIPTLKYFCGEDSWKINPDGHLPKYSEKIENLVSEFEGIAKDLKSGKLSDKEAQTKARGINKSILEIALLPTGPGNPDGFDFDKAVQKYGWRTIDGVTIDLKTLFLDFGGINEFSLWKSRSGGGTQNISHGIEV